MLPFGKTPNHARVAAALLLYSFNNTSLAEVFENHPNSKGLRIESPLPKGYTAIRNMGPNVVFQWGKEPEKGTILWIQLSSYKVPDKEPNTFTKMEPMKWAKALVPYNTGSIVSAVEARTNDTRSIDVVYDYVLNVGDQRWRNLTFARSFFISKRLVVVECISAMLQRQGNAPTISNLNELRNKHSPDCNVVLDGLRIEQAKAVRQ